MRRLKLVLGVAALMVAIMAASAAPAAAQTLGSFGDGDDFCEDLNDCDFDNNFCFFFDCGFDDEFCCDFFDFADGIDQDVEQDAESGDVDQSFDVSQTGDNSNQCVSTQGVANTGNAQNTIGVTDFGFEDDNGDRFDGDGDIEIEDSGASIEVSPTNTTECTS